MKNYRVIGWAALSATLLLSQPANSPKSDEYLLLGSPNRGAGEPIVFVNPQDHNNIIVTAMATLNHLPTGESPIPKDHPGSGELRVKEFSVPDGSRTDIAITRDGGKTWTFGEDSFRKLLKKNRCADSFAGAGPDGTLYMGCLAYINLGSADFDLGWGPDGSPRRRHGGSAIAWSTDKGMTWSNPVTVHPTQPQTPSLYPPNVHPVFEESSPYDRPFFVADAFNRDDLCVRQRRGVHRRSSHRPASQSRSQPSWQRLHRHAAFLGHASADLYPRLSRPGADMGSCHPPCRLGRIPGRPWWVQRRLR